MPTATITSKGQVTVPKAIRDALGLQTGDEVEFVIDGGASVRMWPRGRDIRTLAGLLKEPSRRPVPLEEMQAAIIRRGEPAR